MDKEIKIGDVLGQDDFRAIIINLKEETASGYVGEKAVEAVVISPEKNRFRITKVLTQRERLLAT